MLVPDIKTVSDVMRNKNNIFMWSIFRIDAKSIAGSTVPGVVSGDYKVDIQTITATKADSRTVGVVFIATNTPNTSLADLRTALNNSVSNSIIYRVR